MDIRQENDDRGGFYVNNYTITAIIFIMLKFLNNI